MRKLLLMLFLVLQSASASAHPWGGLVVDGEGAIYFTFVDPIVGEGHVACVWRLAPGAAEPEPVLRATADPSDLVLARDANRVIYAAERAGGSPFRTRLWRFSEDGAPERLLPFVGAAEFNADPYAVGTDGTIHFAHDGVIWSRTSASDPVRVADAPERLSGLLHAPGEPPIQVFSGSLSRGGKVITDRLKLEDPPNVPFAGANILFDVAADSAATYLAYYGNRQVLRVAHDGTVDVLLEAESPWSPSGVDVYEDAVYVLESVTPAPAWKFWQDSTLRPRIRRVPSTGRATTLWEYPLGE